MAGYPLDANGINRELGDAVQRVRDGLATLVRLHELCASAATSGPNGTDACVTVYGATVDDAKAWRDVSGQFKQLSDIAHGEDNYFLWADLHTVTALQ